MITLAPLVIHLLYAASSPPPPKCCAGKCWATSSRLPAGPWVHPAGDGPRGHLYCHRIGLECGLPGLAHPGHTGMGTGQCRRGLLVCLPHLLFVGVGCSPADRPYTRSPKLGVHAALAACRRFDFYVSAESAKMGFWIGFLVTLVAGIFSLRRLDGLVDVRRWLRHRFGARYD